MSRSEHDVILHGIIGAILAGAVVAAWFLVVDFIAGQPFYTPARLATVVLGEEYHGPWPRLVVVYSILHFGVFIALGAAAAWFLREIDLEPGLVVGAVFGIGVMNAVHYSGMLVTGTNLLTVVPTVHVFAANLLGGMLMMAYLHRAMRAEGPLGWEMLRRYPVVYDGTVIGLTGAATVALWFFLVDIVSGQPFRTPAALGSAILLGGGGPADVQLNLGVILAYSFIHITVFAAVGIAFAWLAARVVRASGFWVEATVVLIVLESLFLGTVGIMSEWVITDLGWATILIGNAFAVISMGALLWWRDPRLREVVLKRAVVSNL